MKILLTSFRYVNIDVNGTDIRSVSNGYYIFVEASFDVDTTNGTVFVGDKPLIDAVHMEEMHTWKSPDIIFNFKQ